MIEVIINNTHYEVVPVHSQVELGPLELREAIRRAGPSGSVDHDMNQTNAENIVFEMMANGIIQENKIDLPCGGFRYLSTCYVLMPILKEK